MTSKHENAETMSRITNDDSELSNNGMFSGNINPYGRMTNKKVKPMNVDSALLQSLQNDELYAALIEVCLRRGYLRVTNTPKEGGVV